jgi:hypothetical protein
MEHFLKKTTRLKPRIDDGTDMSTFSFLKMLNHKRGKQGHVGIVSRGDNDCEQLLFKLSRNINYTIEHENIVTDDVNLLTTFCPFFPRKIAMNNTLIYSANEDVNPFSNTNPKRSVTTRIYKNILYMEYLNNACKLSTVIRRGSKASIEQIMSLTRQVMLATWIGKSNIRLTHYDMHSDNIMVQQCPKQAVILYIHDEAHQYCMPTLGYYPIIIDFGFSYSKSVDSNACYSGLGHTDIGFTSNQYNDLADSKLFLVSLRDELKEERGEHPDVRKFQRIVKNMFNTMPLDWETGWDKIPNDRSALDVVTDIVRQHTNGSGSTSASSDHGSGFASDNASGFASDNASDNGSDDLGDKSIFTTFDYDCFEIIQGLTTIPLPSEDKFSMNSFMGAYNVFITEFKKIELIVRGSYYLLYILKVIVDAARNVQARFLKPEHHDDALSRFYHEINTHIATIAQFFTPKGLHYEKMLVSLLIVSEQVGALMCKAINARETTKAENTRKLPLADLEHMFECIDANIPIKYTFTPDSIIFVMNNITKTFTQAPIQLSKHNLNVLNSASSGTGPSASHRGRYLSSLLR